MPLDPCLAFVLGVLVGMGLLWVGLQAVERT